MNFTDPRKSNVGEFCVGNVESVSDNWVDSIGYGDWEKSLINTSTSSYPVHLTSFGNGVVIVYTTHGFGGGFGSCVARSVDYGRTWTVSMPGQEFPTAAIIVGATGNGICFLGESASAYRLFRSVDYGLTWSDVGRVGNATGYSKFVDMGDGNFVMLPSGETSIIHSSDYGQTWSVQTTYPLTIDSVRGMFKINDYLYVVGQYDTSKQYVIRTEDYGITWEIVSTIDFDIQRAFYLRDSNVMLFTCNSNVYITDPTNDGISLIGSTASIGYINPIYDILYLGSGVLFAGGSGYNFAKSIDFGRTWTLVKDFSSDGVSRIYSICYAGNGNILVSVFPTGCIYRYHFLPDNCNVGMIPKANISSILDLLGDTRLLCPIYFTPANDGLVDKSRIWKHAYDYSKNSNHLECPYFLFLDNLIGEIFIGESLYLNFDGTSQRFYQTNNTDFDFGDAATDDAFSVVCCVNPDDVTSRFILGKWDDNNQREWRLFFDANGYPTMQLYDESADTYIGRQDQTAFTTGSWQVLVATYDGSGINAGCKIYIDGVQLDDADYDNGVYVAMEAVTANLMVGALKNAAVYSEYYDGKMTWIGVAAKELSADEVWSLTQRLKGVLGI